MEAVEGTIQNDNVFLQVSEPPTHASYTLTKQYKIPISQIKSLPLLPKEKPDGYCHSVLFWIFPKEIWVGFNHMVSADMPPSNSVKKGTIDCEAKEGKFEGPYLIKDFPAPNAEEVNEALTVNRLMARKDDLYFIRMVKKQYPFLVQLLESAKVNELTFYPNSSEIYNQRPMNVKDGRMTCGGTEKWRLYIIRENVLENVNMKVGRQEIYPPRNWMVDDPPEDVYKIGESVEEAIDRINPEGVEYVVLHGQCHRTESMGKPPIIFNKILLCRYQNLSSPVKRG